MRGGELLLLYLISFLFSCSSPDPTPADAGKKMYPTPVDTVRVSELSEKDKRIAHSIDTFYQNFHKKRGFNGVVLVARGNDVLYKNAFGYGDYEKKTPLKTNSSFQLASISKTITAAAVVRLKEDGLLKLEDPVTKFFPNFPYKGITVRTLLNHRSGLSEYLYFCEDLWKDRSKYISNEEVIKLMTECKPAPYRSADKNFGYCNTNYCLLGAIIEQVSGQSFHTYVDSVFFSPLKMKNSWAGTQPGRTPVKGYYQNWKPAEFDYLEGVIGDKGIYSSAEDLFRWSRAFYSGNLFTKESINEIFTGASNEKPGKRNYGLGWRLIYEDKKLIAAFHNGEWNCFNTVFYRKLDEEITVIVLSNRKNKAVYNIKPILSILSPEGNSDSDSGSR